MQLPLCYKIFRWHPLNIMLQIANQVQPATVISQLVLYLMQLATCLCILALGDIIVLVTCSYVRSYSEITAAFEWLLLFFTLCVFVQHRKHIKQFFHSCQGLVTCQTLSQSTYYVRPVVVVTREKSNSSISRKQSSSSEAIADSE